MIIQTPHCGLHSHTPTLRVIDARSLSIRSVAYCHSTEDALLEERVHQTTYDVARNAIAQRDPRLLKATSAPANLTTIFSLSGKPLRTISVDAGLRMSLYAEAEQSVHSWDGRGSQSFLVYDNQVRPLAVLEQIVGDKLLYLERFDYGGNDLLFAHHNQCGQLIRHDDPAGTQRFTEFGLHGAVLAQARHFLRDLAMPNWPESIADRELLLEPGEGAITFSRFNATGEAIEQTDAKGHRQLFSQTLDGQLREVGLQISGESTAKTLVSAIAYNAHGQTEREVAGNGVITSLQFDAADGRMTRLQAKRGNKILQDLLYAYDPVGNVLSIEDAALPIRYFANQRIEPVNRYAYDSLSQLIEATGWEAGSSNKGPQFSTVDDSTPRANYRQTYRYDAGNNLLELTHEGPQSHGHRLVAAAHSNRCLPVLAGVEPGEDHFRKGFDSNGNLLNLQPGQALSWDLRNQLREVRPVVRDSAVDDIQRYVYGADGMRLRKVRETHTNVRTLIAETRYLPNLELRNHSGTGEVLQVISVQTGRSSVRVLHWESAPPKDSANNQYRYHLNDHLGSCALELDGAGEVISQERYHPFGTTAWFAGRGEIEASYRTVRYSGKERDATGLYYYGFRYYVAGWQRWLNPDPAGNVDGLNIYSMVRNNPINLKDGDGRQSDFDKFFKPDQGDLIFGMYKIVERRYLSWYAKLIYRGDVLAKYFTRKDSEHLVSGLHKIRDDYSKAELFMDFTSTEGKESLKRTLSIMNEDQRALVAPGIKKGYDFWLKEYLGAKDKAYEIESRFYEKIKSSHNGVFSSKVNRGFSESFAAELSGSKYSVFETFHEFVDDESGSIVFKLISRPSKAGLSTMLKSDGAAVVHFALDGLDMNSVVTKSQQSFTSSELRYLYRNRERLADKVLFYYEGKLVDAPWRTDRKTWSRYEPRSASFKV